MQQRKAYQEIETERTLYVLSYGKKSEEVNDVIWLPDGNIIAATNGRSILLWSSTNGTCLRTFPMQRSRVNALACSPDGKHLALGINRGVVERDVAMGSFLFTYSDKSWGEVKSLAWSPNGKYLAWTGNPFYAIQVWDVLTHRQIQFFQEHGIHGSATLAWSPDSTQLVTGDYYGVRKSSYDIFIWEVQTGQILYTLTYHTSPIRTLSWSVDGTYIASGADDGTIHVIDAKAGQRKTVWVKHENQQVTTTAWSYDSKHIAIGLSDGTVIVRNDNFDRVLFSYRCHNAAIRRLAWSLDGRHIASVAYDNTAKVWLALDVKLSIHEKETKISGNQVV